MQQLFSQCNPVLLQIRYATTKCQSDKKRPYHHRFFFVSSKAAKTTRFWRAFWCWNKKHGNTKLILGISSPDVCVSHKMLQHFGGVDFGRYRYSSRCSAQLCHILISNRCETNQCHLCSGLLPTRSLTKPKIDRYRISI